MFQQHLEEHHLNKMYEDMTREQAYLMSQLKTRTSDEEQSDLMKQLTLVNSLTMNLLRLVNLQRKCAFKRNL